MVAHRDRSDPYEKVRSIDDGLPQCKMTDGHTPSCPCWDFYRVELFYRSAREILSSDSRLIAAAVTRQQRRIQRDRRQLICLVWCDGHMARRIGQACHVRAPNYELP